MRTRQRYGHGPVYFDLEEKSALELLIGQAQERLDDGEEGGDAIEQRN